MTQTQSDKDDEIWRGVRPLLPSRVASQLRTVIWSAETEGPKEVGLDEEVASQVRQLKKEEAEAFIVSMNARRREQQAGLEIDPSLTNTDVAGRVLDSAFWSQLSSQRWTKATSCPWLLRWAAP